MWRRPILVLLLALTGTGLALAVNTCAHRAPEAPTPATGPAPASSPPPAVVACGQHCGTERWAVKTLSDDDASDVSSTVQDTTVAALTALPEPTSRPEAARIRSTEVTTFRVRARLLAYKREADEDVHLVLADEQDPDVQMIAEIPNPDVCQLACSSRFADTFRQARAALLAPFGGHLTTCTRWLEDDVRVVLTGVGFFDFPHRQTGLAPNAIELHPVLAVEFDKAGPFRAACRE